MTRTIDARTSVVRTLKVEFTADESTYKVEVTEGSVVEALELLDARTLSLVVREPVPSSRKTVGHVLHIATQDMPIPPVATGRGRRLLGTKIAGPIHFVAYIDEQE